MPISKRDNEEKPNKRETLDETIQLTNLLFYLRQFYAYNQGHL